jgi:hypothetical protein
LDESASVPIPQLLQRIAAAVDQAAAKFASWGVRIEAGSRLEQASAVLREAASLRHINADHTSIEPVLRAMWVAVDFCDIAAYLPGDRVRSIRQELSVAVKGELWPPKGARQSVQFQTQHMIGAILFHSGVKIQHVAFSHKRPAKAPEFFFMDCLTRVGVEVKRPESRRRIPTLLAEAMQKFVSHSCLGAVVMEISDCIEAKSEKEFHDQGAAVMREAHDAVWDTERNQYRPGFGKLIYLGGIVRGGWEVPANDQSRLRLVGHAFHKEYSGHKGTVQAFVSDRTRTSFNQAISSLIARIGDLASRPDA